MEKRYPLNEDPLVSTYHPTAKSPSIHESQYKHRTFPPETIDRLLGLDRSKGHQGVLAPIGFINLYRKELQLNRKHYRNYQKTMRQELKHRLNLIVMAAGSVRKAARVMGIRRDTLMDTLASRRWPSSQTINTVDHFYAQALEAIRLRMLRGSLEADRKLPSNARLKRLFTNRKHDRRGRDMESTLPPVQWQLDDEDPITYTRDTGKTSTQNVTAEALAAPQT